MKRNFTMLTLFTTALLAPLAAFAADRPNVLLILADDLSVRDLGCFGSSYYETPTIDRLASRGVRLTNAYAASPLCSATSFFKRAFSFSKARSCLAIFGSIPPYFVRKR